MNSDLRPAIRHILERREARDRQRATSPAVESEATHEGPAIATAAPGHRRKLGLVVQGGSMRGVFTAGALCALEELGLRDCFDVVYGSSGGAINTAYFLAGQVGYGTSIYYSDINCDAFISFNPARVLSGTALDIDYCFDEVVARRKQLDLRAILDHPTLFKIYVTDPAISRPHAFQQHGIELEEELFAILKASAAMPLVYRRPVHIRGRRYVDGAFLEPVPLFEAIADGCTDVLVFLSRPTGSDPVNIKPWARRLIHRHIRPDNVAASEAAWLHGQRKLEEALDILYSGQPVQNGHERVHLAFIAPPPDFKIHRWTKRHADLVEAAIDGAVRSYELFGVSRDELEPHEAIRLRGRRRS